MKTFGNIDSEKIFIHLVNDHEKSLMESEVAALKDLSVSEDWCIVPVLVPDWDGDLTPWEAEALFPGQNFGGHAKEFLDKLICNIIPDFEDVVSLQSQNDVNVSVGKKYILCGYSLAGLFALWASCQTDTFSGIVAASPSVWYKDWIKYASDNAPKSPNIYLSIGDKEEKAKNPVLATVGDAIRKQHELLEKSGINTCLTYNPGNHFKDSDIRVAKGMAWILETM